MSSPHAGEVLNSIILAGSGRDNEGYVMTLRSNSWFFLVSSPTYWTNTQAGVVCRQLGYSGGVVATDTSGFRYTVVLHTQLTCCLCPYSQLTV